MTYDSHPELKDTYLVYHTEGTGEQGGSGIQRKELMFTTEDPEEIEARARVIYPSDGSSWNWDNYEIEINTTTLKGQMLLADFEASWERIQEEQRLHPEDWTTYQTSHGGSLSVRHNPLFDTPTEPPAMSTARLVFLNPSDNDISH